eukprot:g949.t1
MVFSSIKFAIPVVLLHPHAKEISGEKHTDSGPLKLSSTQSKPKVVTSKVAKRFLNSPLMEGYSRTRKRDKLHKKLQMKNKTILRNAESSSKDLALEDTSMDRRKRTSPCDGTKRSTTLLKGVYAEWQKDIEQILDSLSPESTVKSSYQRRNDFDQGKREVWHRQGGGPLSLKHATQSHRKKRGFDSKIGPVDNAAARLLGVLPSETLDKHQTVKDFNTDQTEPGWSSAHRIGIDVLAPEVVLRQERFLFNNRRAKLREGDLSERGITKNAVAKSEDVKINRDIEIKEAKLGENKKTDIREEKEKRKSTSMMIEEVEKAHNKQLDDIFWTNPLISPIAAPLDHAMLLPVRYQLSRANTRLMFQPDPKKRAMLHAHNSVQGFPYSRHAHEAAFKIQRLVRRRLYRRNDFVLGMQSLFRAHIVRRKVKIRREKINRAVPVIQRMVRGMVLRKWKEESIVLQRQQTAVTIQRVFRGKQGRNIAALQVVVRNHGAALPSLCEIGRDLGRKQGPLRRTEYAAPLVQRYMRGLTTKAGVRRRVEIESFKAQQIMALFRGAQGRRWARLKRFERICKASLTIQRFCHGLLARIYARARFQAVLISQRGARYFLGRLAYEKMRMAFENEFVLPKGEAEQDRVERWLQTGEGRRYFKEVKLALKQEQKDERFNRRTMDPELKSRKELRETFDMFDLDGSGLIDRGEFKSVVDAMGEPFTQEELDAAFAEMDEDGSGEVDYGEFKNWWLGKMGKSGARVALLKMKLKAYRAVRVLLGAEINMLTKRRIIIEKKAAVMRDARIWWRENKIQPKHACETCLCPFVSSRLLYNHTMKGLCNETDVTRLPCRFFED